MTCCPTCGTPLAEQASPGGCVAVGAVLADLAVADSGLVEGVAGITLSGLAAVGQRTLFHVTGPHDLALDVGVIRWCDGETEVRRARAGAQPWALDRRLGDARLAARPWDDGHLLVHLGLPPACDSGAQRAKGAGGPPSGVCARCALLAAGAFAVGTEQDLLGGAGAERYGLVAAFARRLLRVAVVAFVLVHVLPALASCAFPRRVR